MSRYSCDVMLYSGHNAGILKGLFGSLKTKQKICTKTDTGIQYHIKVILNINRESNSSSFMPLLSVCVNVLSEIFYSLRANYFGQ